VASGASACQPDQGPFEEIEGDVAMKSEKLEVVRGSGNVFRDLGHDNADAEQFKAILAAEIIKALDREHLTVRAAQSRTGTTAADFSRIRNADLGRFTADRHISIINRLGSRGRRGRGGGQPARPLPLIY
jgi:predicted XRE-type DNA-binding protein